MSVLSKVLGRIMKLPPATGTVRVERNLRIPMRDGVQVLAHRYVPEGAANAPLILVRSPYGRAGAFGILTGELFAERGFQVVLVSVRGTFGSGGVLFPFQQEKDDGADVVKWLRTQHFYPGAFATHGPSYLGLTQWAIAASAGPELKAMSLQVTASEFRNQTYAGESFALENALAWSDLITHQELPLAQMLWHQVYKPNLARALMHLPLREADRIATGQTVSFYQQWLLHETPGDPWWAPAMHDDTVAQVTAAIQMSTGWYDLFLPWQLQDYERLKAAGRAPRLTIGPWAHADPKSFGAALRAALPWLNQILREDPAPPTPPVRIFVGGQEAWRELAVWPPESKSVRWYLQAQRGLSAALPTHVEPDTFIYDPATPTPSVGGPLLQGKTSGPRDNRKLEARSDVLVYTSPVLTEDLEVIGIPEADLFVRSSLGHSDFFARLCDVHPNGLSLNVCDALLRVKDGMAEQTGDGQWHLRFALWPTAHRFLAGHRLRVQISSGAHPRYARNLGTGEPLGAGTRMHSATQTVFHDPEHPSAILLPVTSPASSPVTKT